MAEILDACCGGRMWWWDKAHPLAVYMDKRVAPKGSAAAFDVEGGTRHASPGWSCEPDVVGDFRAMPFPDESFRLVVFDPPHNIRDEPKGVNGLMYGALPAATEQDDLRRGFAECWRVLKPGGTLIFKWAGDIKRVKPHFPTVPIECNYEGDIDVHPEEIDFASWTCPGCKAENTVRDHEVCDSRPAWDGE